jgi:hypothetical protein
MNKEQNVSGESDPDNILPFRVRDPNEPLVEFDRYKYGTHEHGRFLLNERAGTVLCQRCNKYMDPFVALCITAEQWRDQDYKFKAIQEYDLRQKKKREADRLKRVKFIDPPA